MRKNILNLFLAFFILLSNNVKASNKTLKFELQPRSHYVKSEADITDDTFCNALGLIEKSKVLERIIRAKHLVIGYVVQKVDDKDEDSLEVAEELIKEVDPSLWDIAIRLAKSKR